MKKSQVAGILFGVAMGAAFSVTLGTVGFVLGASFARRNACGTLCRFSQAVKGLDDPQNKDKK